MKNEQLFVKLFNKYLDNCCSPEEVDYLFGLMRSGEYSLLATEMIDKRLKTDPGFDDTDYALRERLDARLGSILDTSSGSRHRLYAWRWIAAASVLLVVFVSIYRFEPGNTPAKIIPVASVPLAAASLAGYTRYITLPDGSSVVLHAGSKLEYPNVFAGKTREVRLSGEAYFDVFHNPEKPFIIHTGSVKTTVLGTAFNIKSDEKKVVVSVTRGKVKVEDATRIVAVLTPDQQVEYNVKQAAGAQHVVDAKTVVTDWTKENMVFDGITFGEIGKILSQRYGVPVRFENEALKNCKIRASFSGTEALDHVASVLSATRNGSFEQATDGTIVFTGEGCD
ncbi:MAG: FecR domain-containing protein [Chitinophagaceae bacterium]|nr:FecR domain-containing protein [Chitinophagaceae bacterium]